MLEIRPKRRRAPRCQEKSQRQWSSVQTFSRERANGSIPFSWAKRNRFEARLELGAERGLEIRTQPIEHDADRHRTHQAVRVQHTAIASGAHDSQPARAVRIVD